MGALSRFIQNTILDVMTGRTASYSTSGQVWAQLHTGGSPGVDGTSNFAPGMARQQVSWGTPASRQVVTAAAFAFADFQHSESGSPYISLWDASSDGQFLAADQVTPPGPISIGDTWTIPSGQLRLRLNDAQASDAFAHRILNMVIGAAALTGSGVAPYVQAHSGDPGADGTANVCGSNVVNAFTGASGRIQTRAWSSAPANGIISGSTSQALFGYEVRGNAPQSITHSTYWDASSGGNYLGKRSSAGSALHPGDIKCFSLASFNIPTNFSIAQTF